jgi:hypothetical protein
MPVLDYETIARLSAAPNAQLRIAFGREISA